MILTQRDLSCLRSLGGPTSYDELFGRLKQMAANDSLEGWYVLALAPDCTYWDLLPSGEEGDRLVLAAGKLPWLPEEDALHDFAWNLIEDAVTSPFQNAARGPGEAPSQDEMGF